ncbi:hypothetical protein DB42_CO00110 [Neochlamydia sp. EPS4]|nr:hypothetical protein DB42_CO00110 [Neochlamydia sp. EPS4]
MKPQRETLKAAAVNSYSLIFFIKIMEKPIDLNSNFKLNNLFVMRRS